MVARRGRQFSQVIEEVTVDDHGNEIHVQQLTPLDFWDDKAIVAHLEWGISILEAQGIDVQASLLESPHGSLLRDTVLNSLNHEPDSQIGLAARIVEMCLHIRAYADLPGGDRRTPGLMARLSHLATLAKVYEIADRPRREGGRESGRARAAEAEGRHEEIIEIANRLLSSGKDRRAIAGIIADRVGLSPRQIRTILKGAGI